MCYSVWLFLASLHCCLVIFPFVWSIQHWNHYHRWKQGEQSRWESWTRLSAHHVLFTLHKMTAWSSCCLDSPTSCLHQQRGGPLSSGQVTLLGWANVWVSLGILLPGTLSCFPLSAWTLFFSLCLFFLPLLSTPHLSPNPWSQWGCGDTFWAVLGVNYSPEEASWWC